MAAAGARTVLVVDDEPMIADIVARYLRAAGYHTVVARDGEEALRLSDLHRPDLVVLDVMLPGIDGLEVMSRLRRRRPAAVLLLTARGEHDDRIAGLRLGADDYLSKPFFPGELVARVQAVLRRVGQTAGGGGEDPMEFQDIRVEAAERRVLVRRQEVALTTLEFDLLLFLIARPGRVFSRDELLAEVWRHSFPTDTATVTVHVRRLRQKIEADPAHPRWIQTVWGVGYRFQP